MSSQQEYAESVRSSQRAAEQAVATWAKSAQSAFTAPPRGAEGPFDPNQVIDQVFNFAEQMLGVQREFAKTLAATAASTGDVVQKQVKKSAPERNPGNYDDLTKAQLQQELAGRGLPKTGNVGDLRKRLLDDDRK
ncbi:MAG: SAP domain-containing protein [Nocardioidaceae bacterium]|nr:SAP domain-containing protein [Nocardioidaceae bacterium]